MPWRPRELQVAPCNRGRGGAGRGPPDKGGCVLQPRQRGTDLSELPQGGYAGAALRERSLPPPWPLLYGPCALRHVGSHPRPYVICTALRPNDKLKPAHHFPVPRCARECPHGRLPWRFPGPCRLNCSADATIAPSAADPAARHRVALEAIEAGQLLARIPSLPFPRI